jgi:hypothetical protein
LQGVEDGTHQDVAALGRLERGAVELGMGAAGVPFTVRAGRAQGVPSTVAAAYRSSQGHRPQESCALEIAASGVDLLTEDVAFPEVLEQSDQVSERLVNASVAGPLPKYSRFIPPSSAWVSSWVIVSCKRQV